MHPSQTFERRGIVEGFFGPVWSMSHRKALFQFGAPRGMNTYLYAPKDDPYHRARWRQAYPRRQWKNLLRLIREAQKQEIDFVYGFHPGKGLCFYDNRPIETLLAKAQRFYDAGVRTFAVLFDDIPSWLEHKIDRQRYASSLARAQGTWLQKIYERQPDSWQNVEWWICPSYYTPDPMLARVWGDFEPYFLETLAEYLPPKVACFWTGPLVVPKKVTAAHVGEIARRIKRRLILWDNYPVNDLSMRDELHIGPLRGRDSHLPQALYGYLNNPMLQEELSFIPLATCFDYAADPRGYDSEASWRQIIVERFGVKALSHWRRIRRFCEASQRAKKTGKQMRLPVADLKLACSYIDAHGREKWSRELRPWRNRMLKMLS